MLYDVYPELKTRNPQPKSHTITSKGPGRQQANELQTAAWGCLLCNWSSFGCCCFCWACLGWGSLVCCHVGNCHPVWCIGAASLGCVLLELRWGPPGKEHTCREAGPKGHVACWACSHPLQVAELGVTHGTCTLASIPVQNV